jgi:cell wall-associated NlpC family hydrolase
VPIRSHRIAGLTRIPPITLRLAVAAFAAVLLLFAATVGASANPSIDDKRARAQAILGEIDALDHEVGDAAERYNGATYELGKITSELGETRDDLAQARQLQRVSQTRIAARLRTLYMNGDTVSAVEVILGAASLDDLVDRIDIAERVASQDARIGREAKALRERVARREKELTAARERQSAVVRQRVAEKRAIEGRLVERQRLLASVKDEIAELEEAERRRQAELRRQARVELERQRRAAEAARRAQAAAPQAAVTTPSSDAWSSVGEGPPDATPSVDDTPPPADVGRGAQVVAIAMQYLGVPYVWGAADPSVGFDCSGLTKYVFAKVGVSLPHYAAAQYQLGSPVSKDQLQPGDLVFFRNLGHMGMYIGGGNFVHAPRTGDVVKISPLSDPYYVANWVGARRVL